MRRSTLGLVLSLAVLLPAEGAAQATWYPTQYPRVTAANAPWLYSGDPIYYAGTLYYPRGATTFFDGDVMSRIGTYEGVPLFADATQTPFSVIFVPLGGKMMKPYERKRDGEVAGTVASRTPWFPVQVASEWFPIEEPPFGITTIEPPVNLYQPDFYQSRLLPVRLLPARLLPARPLPARTQPVPAGGRPLPAGRHRAVPARQLLLPARQPPGCRADRCPCR